MNIYPIDEPIPFNPEAEGFAVVQGGMCTSFYFFVDGLRYWFVEIWQYDPNNPNSLTIDGRPVDRLWVKSVLTSLDMPDQGQTLGCSSATISDADVVKLRMMAAG